MQNPRTVQTLALLELASRTARLTMPEPLEVPPEIQNLRGALWISSQAAVKFLHLARQIEKQLRLQGEEIGLTDVQSVRDVQASTL